MYFIKYEVIEFLQVTKVDDNLTIKSKWQTLKVLNTLDIDYEHRRET
jgi:hypothetical protein